MVVFICNACGDSLKKQQVDKHLFQICRKGQTVSCVDCSKDFTSQSYKEHIKCFTEDEKYSGKGYQPKVNKGQVKQEQWITRVQEALANVGNDRQLGNILERLLDKDNIPRKKAKFANFMQNSFRPMINNALIERIWNIVESQAKPPAPPADSGNKPDESKKREATTKEEEEETSPAKKKKTEAVAPAEEAGEASDELPKFSLNQYILEQLAEKPSGISFDKLLKKATKAAADTSRYRPSKKMESFDDTKLEKALVKLNDAGQVSYSNEEKEKRIVLISS